MQSPAGKRPDAPLRYDDGALRVATGMRNAGILGRRTTGLLGTGRIGGGFEAGRRGAGGIAFEKADQPEDRQLVRDLAHGRLEHAGDEHDEEHAVAERRRIPEEFPYAPDEDCEEQEQSRQPQVERRLKEGVMGAAADREFTMRGNEVFVRWEGQPT